MKTSVIDTHDFRWGQGCQTKAPLKLSADEVSSILQHNPNLHAGPTRELQHGVYRSELYSVDTHITQLYAIEIARTYERESTVLPYLSANE
jgi:hypothetical protein